MARHKTHYRPILVECVCSLLFISSCLFLFHECKTAAFVSFVIEYVVVVTSAIIYERPLANENVAKWFVALLGSAFTLCALSPIFLLVRILDKTSKMK